MKFCYLYLTCDIKEADLLIDLLLEKRLIVCAKKVPVNSTYWWKNEIEKAVEVMLIMESAEEKFDEVEAELAKVHSYNTFVMTAVPMVKVSKEAKKWMEDNIGDNNK